MRKITEVIDDGSAGRHTDNDLWRPAIEQERLSVAVPWSLSHYILLNGFHPLYRALFDQRPLEVSLNAWDNVDLAKVFEDDAKLLARVLKYVRASRHAFAAPLPKDQNGGKLAQLRKCLQKIKHVVTMPRERKIVNDYLAHFWQPNVALSDLLPGQIEFHHTAPFPTMRRPFVFHCEAVAPVFFPFAHQGTGSFKLHGALRTHYRKIFASPLCLGIFSHLPETLRDLSKFFADPEIDVKLHQSRIGLSEHSFPRGDVPPKKPLAQARFMFLNSAHQRPGSFFMRGGAIVLRFWKEFRALGNCGRLFMRCDRPTDLDLRAHGVDLAFLRSEEHTSIFWIDNYLTMEELNALLAESHFLLLPSWSLHSASIMQALAMGAVPVVTDTMGTSLYVTDDQNGIMLKGVFSSNWHTDAETGILIDRYHRNPALDEQLVSQLTQRISALMAAPHKYEQLRTRALECSRTIFSGRLFSEDFWNRAARLCAVHPICPAPNVERTALTAQLAGCLIKDSQWSPIFESTPQPVFRRFAGRRRVTELAGTFIADDDTAARHHDWSVMAKHIRPNLSRLRFAHSIKELEGEYLPDSPRSLLTWLTTQISLLLRPFPAVRRFSSDLFRLARRVRNKLHRMRPDKY